MAQIEVTGCNGYLYFAKPVKDDLYIVGTFIVRVKDGTIIERICRATRASVAAYRE